MRKKEKPVESKAEYYFGDKEVLERAVAENEFEGSRVEEQDMEELLRIQEEISDLPSFWKDLFTKLAFESKTPILWKCKTDDNISGIELFHLEKSFFQAHPCQITLLQEITIDSYFNAAKIFKLTGLPNVSTIPDLELAVFCYLVHSTTLASMAPYEIKLVFVREDEAIRWRNLIVQVGDLFGPKHWATNLIKLASRIYVYGLASLNASLHLITALQSSYKKSRMSFTLLSSPQRAVDYGDMAIIKRLITPMLNKWD